MEVINKTVIASVEISDIRVSEDELGLYEAALSYLLNTLSDENLEDHLGATRDELEGMRDDLRQAVTHHYEFSSEPVLTSNSNR